MANVEREPIRGPGGGAPSVDQSRAPGGGDGRGGQGRSPLNLNAFCTILYKKDSKS